MTHLWAVPLLTTPSPLMMQVYVKHMCESVRMTNWGRVYYTNALALVPLMIALPSLNEQSILSEVVWSTQVARRGRGCLQVPGRWGVAGAPAGGGGGGRVCRNGSMLLMPKLVLVL